MKHPLAYVLLGALMLTGTAGARQTPEEPVPNMWRVRAGYGELWGIAGSHVYNSTDEGYRWHRVGSTDFDIKGLAIQSTDEIMMWDEDGRNVTFDRRTSETTPIADLGSRHLFGLVQAHNLWATYGGILYDNPPQDSAPGAGRFDHAGFVSVSRDRGRTWQEIHRWDGNIVAAMFLMPDESMVLFSFRSATRWVSKVDGQYIGRTVLEATAANRHKRPRVYDRMVIYFTDVHSGYVGGDLNVVGCGEPFYLPHQFFETGDGGVTWAEIDRNTFPYHMVRRIGDRYVGAWESTVYLLDEKKRRPICNYAISLRGARHLVTDLSPVEPDGLLVEIGTRDADGSPVGRHWILCDSDPFVSQRRGGE